MSDQRDQIEERLDQGIVPTEAEVRWLLAEHADKERTIALLTDAALDLLRAVTDTLERPHRDQAPPPGAFFDHAGQFIDR